MKFLALTIFLFAFASTGHCADKPDDLVNVLKIIPDIVLDIRYATTNNFMGKKVYPSSKCFLRRAAVEKLAAAQKEFKKSGYGIKIYDGYRPLSVQRKLWEIVPDDRYVANPKKGSRHNRGAAVDLTLIYKSGKELLMPTPYDDFTEKAHRDFKELPAETIRNRELLQSVMEKNGFKGLPTEWWHFDDVDWEKYKIMDVDFEQLKE